MGEGAFVIGLSQIPFLSLIRSNKVPRVRGPCFKCHFLPHSSSSVVCWIPLHYRCLSSDFSVVVGAFVEI